MDQFKSNQSACSFSWSWKSDIPLRIIFSGEIERVIHFSPRLGWAGSFSLEILFVRNVRNVYTFICSESFRRSNEVPPRKSGRIMRIRWECEMNITREKEIDNKDDKYASCRFLIFSLYLYTSKLKLKSLRFVFCVVRFWRTVCGADKTSCLALLTLMLTLLNYRFAHFPPFFPSL